MFCKKCGTQLDDDAQFCEHCGTVIKRIIQETSEDTISDARLEHESPVTSENPTERFNDSQPPVVARKKSQKGLIIGVVAVVVIAVGLLFTGLIGGNSTKGGNLYQEVNFNNGAKFAYDDSRLYIIGLYDKDDDDTSLYSTNYKGVNKTLISDNENINSIRVVDGKIYYRASEDDEYIIGVMDTDGTNDTVIITSSESLGRYDVYNKTLYYLQDSKVHTCTLTGENDEVIVESADTFTLCNGYLYYVDSNDVISSYKLKNGETTELCKSAGATDLSVDGKTIYFENDTGLCSVLLDEDNTVTKIIRDDSLSGYVFYDGYIYYNHQMSSDDIKEIAEYLGDASSEVTTYKLALIGAGYLYRAEMTGGDGESVDSDQFFVSSLYAYPNGMYCKLTIWSDSLEPIELE